MPVELNPSPSIGAEGISPVALFIFNRPEITQQIVGILQRINIPTLFVVADGPRPGNLEDEVLCRQTRKIVDSISWDCKVHKLYREVNVGCGHSPAQGLDWVFSQVDRCIILEDDCIPHPSFFRYCSELLERYLADPRIMMISGDNYLLGRHPISNSYLFSINTQTHGWATWRRAWERYDFYMKDWPQLRSLSWLNQLLANKSYAKSWLKNFDFAYYEANHNPNCTFWDYQWIYACWKYNGLTIIPSVNLISNIGYGQSATHTLEDEHPLAALACDEMPFPLKHPEIIARDFEADDILKTTAFGYKPLYIKIFRKILKTLGF